MFICAAMQATVGPAQTALAPLVLAAYATPYVLRVRTLRRRGQPVPAWRRACFAGGFVLLLIAVSAPVDQLAADTFAAHMVEHLLIGDLAPLLVLLGLSGPVLAPLLRRRAVQRLQPLTHPAVAFGLWALDLYLWHLRIAYEGAIRHDLIHVVEHACFFGFGLLLWMPLFGPLPKPAWFGNAAMLGYIVLVRLTGAVLANAFVWSNTVFYPYYGSLGDQSAAGAVMMIEQSVVTLGLFCWLFLKTARDSEERQELAELAEARGVELDEQRIARAVAAGRGEALRRRLAGTSE